MSWLREYVDLELSPEALAARLTLLGMEVKRIERPGTDWSGVVIGELLTVEDHPNSGRLHLTTVRVANDTPPLSIVCGAHNIAPGQHVPVALPGSVLPGGRRIGIARLAGVDSQGMLCSGTELGLSDDAEGILILPSDTSIGLPLEDLVGDTVLDVDVKPNRGDALSIIGLAREVAAATGAILRWPPVEVAESGDATLDHVAVEVQDPIRCPRFVARWLDGVTVGPSPFVVQRRLTAAGIRPISNIVDASNYVMLEMGKPIHTFDADGIRGARIIVRGAHPGERVTTLDHVERVVDAEVLLIADPAGPLGLAGVMGGVDSEVGEGTTRVVVESAVFDPVSIRRTASRFALRSEASLRFEKGQEHRLARVGADRCAQLILAWAGGRAARGVVDTSPVEPPLSRVPFRPARVSRVLGVDVPAVEQATLLGRVGVATEPADPADQVPVTAGGLSVASGPDALVAIVPAHRRDLVIEADIIEEVARVRGYETLPSSLPSTPMPGYRPDPRRLTDRLRGWLAGTGLTEVVTHGLVDPADHVRLGLAAGDRDSIVAANPVTLDHSEMRRSLLPGLLHVLGHNQRLRRIDAAVFEIGPTHLRVHGLPTETPTLAFLLVGAARPATWSSATRSFDVADGKGIVELLARRLGDARVTWATVVPRAGVDHPGRTAAAIAHPSAAVDREPVPLGRVGEIHPALLEAYDIRAPHVVFGEIPLSALAALVPARVMAGELERPPAIERDLAVVVDRGVAAGTVGELIRSAAGSTLDSLALFDRYQGAPLEPHEMSLAWRLRFDPVEGSATDAAVDDLMGQVASVLSERIGGRLRG